MPMNTDKLIIEILKTENMLLQKELDTVKIKVRFNPNHDPKNGQFTEGDGQGDQSDTVTTVTPKEALKNAFENALNCETSNEVVTKIIENHEALGEYTPQELKGILEEIGLDVKPLGKGNFKGVPFEEGGGFRINFGGDGTFRYHPEERSHHKKAYYKVSNGKEKHRYGIDGSEIFD